MFVLQVTLYAVILCACAENAICSCLEINRLAQDAIVLAGFLLYACLWLGVNASLLYAALVFSTQINWSNDATGDREQIRALPDMTAEQLFHYAFAN